MAAFRATATAVETGESAYAVRIAFGGHELTGDEPVEAGGGGLGPGPFDLLAGSLAERTTMTIRWYARQQAWRVEAIEVTVEYSRKAPAAATAPVDVFEKTISIRGADLTDEQRAQLPRAAARCPTGPRRRPVDHHLRPPRRMTRRRSRTQRSQGRPRG